MSAEYADWMRAISFYQDEIKILNNRLSEVSQRYTNTDVKVEVEHYQNQFIIQNNNLGELWEVKDNWPQFEIITGFKDHTLINL